MADETIESLGNVIDCDWQKVEDGLFPVKEDYAYCATGEGEDTDESKSLRYDVYVLESGKSYATVDGWVGVHGIAARSDICDNPTDALQELMAEPFRKAIFHVIGTVNPDDI